MNFATLTGKHLCWKLLFNKVLGLQSAALFEKKNSSGTDIFNSKVKRKGDSGTVNSFMAEVSII